MRWGWILPSAMRLPSATAATSRRSGSKQDSVTESGVSSTMTFTPVSASNVRMFRPSLPMIRPFISSAGSGTTVTVVCALVGPAEALGGGREDRAARRRPRSAEPRPPPAARSPRPRARPAARRARAGAAAPAPRSARTATRAARRPPPWPPRPAALAAFSCSAATASRSAASARIVFASLRSARVSASRSDVRAARRSTSAAAWRVSSRISSTSCSACATRRVRLSTGQHRPGPARSGWPAAAPARCRPRPTARTCTSLVPQSRSGSGRSQRPGPPIVHHLADQPGRHAGRVSLASEHRQHPPALHLRDRASARQRRASRSRAAASSSASSIWSSAARASSSPTPLRLSSTARARRARPRDSCLVRTSISAYPASSTSPTSVNRSSTRAATSSGTSRRAIASASCCRLRGAPVSRRKRDGPGDLLGIGLGVHAPRAPTSGGSGARPGRRRPTR